MGDEEGKAPEDRKLGLPVGWCAKGLDVGFDVGAIEGCDKGLEDALIFSTVGCKEGLHVDWIEGIHVGEIVCREVGSVEIIDGFSDGIYVG